MRPFRIEIPQADSADLERRLAATRWPADPPDDTYWDRGVPQRYLRELVEYWRSGYDWPAAEARLNRFPQFITEIDGAPVHFLHVRSPEPEALPLILTHGWPGSVAEFSRVIGPLTDPRAHGGDTADAFHLVVPSIPGFGFSGPLRQNGWNVERVASAWAELIRRLGYNRYAVQGGDFGSLISLALAGMDREHVVGAHVNFLITPVNPAEEAELSAPDRGRLMRVQRFIAAESGYMKIQSTRPYTPAYGLADSPVGQLAWIAEKFHDWAGSGIDADDLLTNVCIYWFTATAGSAAQFYYENAGVLPTAATPSSPLRQPLDVPLAVASFPHDPGQPIRRVAERMFPNIVRWTDFERGGHFPALEVPDLFVDDLREFGRAISPRRQGVPSVRIRSAG